MLMYGKENLDMPAWIVGVVCAALTALVIFGGVKVIAKVCEKLVPFMAIFYVLGCIIILIYNYDYIIPAIQTIVTLAFKPGAAAGGLVGSGIMMGRPDMALPEVFFQMNPVWVLRRS